MWFKRKAKNKRHERSHVLDVKVRSNQARLLRLRLAGTLLSICFGLVIALLAVWHGGEWAVERLIFQNDTFAIRELSVETDGRLPVGLLQRWADVKEGDNLLALDLGEIRRNLELSPLVESAAVERVLPDRLRIRVVERRALARIYAFDVGADGTLARRSVVLDRHGYVMVPLVWEDGTAPAQARVGALPVISGVAGTELRPGLRVESGQVAAALELIDVFKDSAMMGLVDLERIDVSEPNVLVAYTGSRSRITFSPTGLMEQMRRWRLVFDHGRSRGRRIGTLDLSISNNVPATWQDPGGVSSIERPSWRECADATGTSRSGGAFALPNGKENS